MPIIPSIGSSFFPELTPEDALRTLKSHGYDCAELSTEHIWQLFKRGFDRQIAQNFRSVMDDLGMAVPQARLKKLDLTVSSPEDLHELFETYYLEFHLLHTLRVKAVTLCPGSVSCLMPDFQYGSGPKWEQMVKNLVQILQLCNGANFTLCLENQTGFFSTYEQLQKLMDDTPGGEKLGFCLNTGHLHMMDGNQRDFILKAGSRLKATHIADCRTVGTQREEHYLPYGNGIDWKDTVSALREVNYDGLFNFEVPQEVTPSHEWNLLTLDHSRRLADLLLNGNIQTASLSATIP